MISGEDFIALITLIVFVYAQTPYWNGNVYRAIPAWLDYIGATLIPGRDKTQPVVVHPSWKVAGQLFFSVVWFIIYAFMVATAYLIYDQPPSVQLSNWLQTFYGLFIVNIILNKFWTPVFFGEYKYFAWGSESTTTADLFTEKVKDKVVTKVAIYKYNCPTIVRVTFAGIVALLVFATAAAMLGVVAVMVNDNVITDKATRVVSLLGLSIYTLWTLVAIVMNAVLACCVASRDQEIAHMLPVKTTEIHQ